MQERVLGQMEWTFALPTDVPKDESKATFNNGILELPLKKIHIAPEIRIFIEFNDLQDFMTQHCLHLFLISFL